MKTRRATNLFSAFAAAGLLAFSSFASSQTAVSFLTEDGGVVHGSLYGTSDRGVVLAHGGRFTKESWAEQAPVIADGGFRVLAIDFRGRGESHGPPDSASPGRGAYYDVIAAVSYLREQGATSVAVVGASFGGSMAARAAVASPGTIDRLVLLASPIDQPEKVGGRKLFIVARGDQRGGGVLRLPGIEEDFRLAPEPKELVVLEGSAHAQFLFDTDQGDRLLVEILRFLSAP